MGIARKMVHEATIKKGTVHHWPGLEIIENKQLPWYMRAAIWTGVIMATPETPKGWSFNPSTVTLALVIAGMIAGGAYYVGQNDAERRHLLERIEKAERNSSQALTLSAASSAGVGHEEKKEEPKKK